MRANTTVVTTATAPSMQERFAPMIDRLAVPLEQVRASLGTGQGGPDAELLAALSSADTSVAATENPQRSGLYELESTGTAAVATPSLRVTNTEVAAAADKGKQFTGLLTAAHTTQSTAAAKVDQIIVDFRKEANQLASKATTSADTAKIIDLAADAIREAVSVASTASTEMDDHTRKLSALGDNGGTNGTGVTVPSGFQGGTGTLSTNGTYGTNSNVLTSGTTNLGTGGTSTGTGSSLSSLLSSTELPDDPNLRAQVLLQYAALEAGVSLGEKALDAGVSIGSSLIESIAGVIEHGFDKGAEVATSAIDTVADKADSTVQQALTGESGTSGTGTGTGASGTSSPAGAGTSGSRSDLFAGLGNGTSGGSGGAAAKPEAPASGGEGTSRAEPKVTQAPATGQTTTPSPAPSQAPFQQAPMQGGVVTPPVNKPTESEHKPSVPSTDPKRGQAGVIPDGDGS
ncbi:hypothetical protein ACFYTF_20165 [Nocardia thailandica]|uniref:Uncharacterized protein n=1 Tax=Nocardia thailandica TaxID=257275 RepID=A0ABW6PRV1_9NOCA